MKKKVDLLFISSEDSREEELVNILRKNAFSPEKIINKKTIEEILRTKSSDIENIYSLLTDENKTLSPDEQLLETYLYSALENDEFVMYYQPVINLTDGSLYGFESLIR